jgi:Holliday junction resolvasome RuvABC endonuclease subunit
VSGFDLSLTGTGVCNPDGSTEALAFKPRKKGADVQTFEMDRLVWLVDKLIAGCMTHKTQLVAIEGPVLMSHAALVLGGLQGVVKLELYRLGIPFVIVPATSVKKYATGKGTAKKSDMAVAGFKRAGLEGVTEDEVDAWWVRAIACDLIGRPLLELPELNRMALVKLRENIPASVAGFLPADASALTSA